MPYLGKTPSQATRQRYYKTASGGETSISGTMTTGGTLTFNDGEFVDVKLNGVSLVAGTDYNTTTANTIGGLSALAANDQVEIVVYDTFSVFSGDVDSNLSVGGNLSVTGTSALTGAATITTDDNNPQLTLTTTDADAGTGPTLDLFRNSASPADADVGGKISFTGKNDAAETLGMVIFQASHVDVSDGTEDAKLAISSRSAGSMLERLNLDATETVFNEGGADLNFRVESDNNTHAIFVNAGNDRVNINSSANPSESCQFYVNDVALIGGTNAVTGGFPTSGLGIITTQGSHCAIFYDDNDLANPRFNFARNGNLTVSGAVSKGSGSFRIDHPLPAKTSTHDLVHSFIEGPQADLIYRGKVDLVAGSATVNIDTAAGMTDGTFVLLCGDVQCFTSNEDGFTAVKGSVSGNTLTITAEADTCTDTISWMVVGERKDQHMVDTTWTDDNGKVIVEPLKGSQEVSEEE